MTRLLPHPASRPWAQGGSDTHPHPLLDELLLRAYTRELRDLGLHRSAEAEYRYVLHAQRYLAWCRAQGIDVRRITPVQTDEWLQANTPGSMQWMAYSAGRRFMQWLSVKVHLDHHIDTYFPHIPRSPQRNDAGPKYPPGTLARVIPQLPPKLGAWLALREVERLPVRVSRRLTRGHFTDDFSAYAWRGGPQKNLRALTRKALITYAAAHPPHLRLFPGMDLADVNRALGAAFETLGETFHPYTGRAGR